MSFVLEVSRKAQQHDEASFELDAGYRSFVTGELRRSQTATYQSLNTEQSLSGRGAKQEKTACFSSFMMSENKALVKAIVRISENDKIVSDQKDVRFSHAVNEWRSTNRSSA